MNALDPQRPFAGKKLSRRERRLSERRARERADARARAMPPPEAATRVDPITGKPVHVHLHSSQQLPAARTTAALPAVPLTSASQLPAAAPQRALPPGTPTPTPPANTEPANPSTTQDTAPATGHDTGQADATGPRPAKQRRATKVRARLSRRSRTAEPAATEEPETPTTEPEPVAAFKEPEPAPRPPTTVDRLLEPVDGPNTRWIFLGGIAVAVLGICLAVGTGLPVLGHGTDPVMIGLGALTALFGGYLCLISAAATGPKTKFFATSGAALLTAAFCVGVATNPVIVDGKVLLSTSKQAQSARLAQDIYHDLATIATNDDLLAAALPDARSNVSAYDPAMKQMQKMNAKYAQLKPSDLPDETFAATVEATKTAAYWSAKAFKTKKALIEQDDTKASADLATQRAAMADNWMTAAAELKKVAQALNIPYTTELEGPHE